MDDVYKTSTEKFPFPRSTVNQTSTLMWTWPMKYCTKCFTNNHIHPLSHYLPSLIFQFYHDTNEFYVEMLSVLMFYKEQNTIFTWIQDKGLFQAPHLGFEYEVSGWQVAAAAPTLTRGWSCSHWWPPAASPTTTSQPPLAELWSHSSLEHKTFVPVSFWPCRSDGGGSSSSLGPSAGLELLLMQQWCYTLLKMEY